MAALAVATAAISGCAIHNQVQYFAATDPNTGATNYYKMTISGWGGLGTDYHLQAGYFSSAAVDVLRGSMPNVPILDLPVEQLEVFDRLTTHFYAALIQEAKRLHNVSDPEAILIAARSTRNTADRRLGRLERQVAGVQHQLAAYETTLQRMLGRLTGAENGLEDAENSASEALEKRGQGHSTREDKRLVFLDAEVAVEDALDQRKSKVQEVQSKLLGLQAELVAAQQAGDQEAIDTAQAAVNEAQIELQQVRQVQNEIVETAEAARSGAEQSLRDAEQELRDAERSVRTANSRKTEAVRQHRDAELAADAAQRTADRAQGKVDSLQVEVRRNQAARDAANEMLEKLNERLDAAPFSPLAEDAAIKPFQDPEIIALARVVWFGSLSTSDLASIGMTGNTSPFQFRKLVFWATANNIDLNAFASEIDGVIDNVVAIAQTAKTQATNRKSARKSQRESLMKLVEQLEPDPLKADGLKSIIEMLSPAAPGNPPPAFPEVQP